METILFASSFVGVLAVSLTLFWLGGLSFRRPSPSSLFVAFYIASAYLGIWFLFFEQNHRAIGRGVIDHTVVWTMFGLSATTLFLMAVGFVLIPTSANLRLASETTPLTGRGFTAALAIFGFCCGVFVLYLMVLPQVPLFAALRGDTADAITLRTTLLTTNQVRFGKVSYYHAAFRMLLPFLAYVFFAHALLRHTARAWLAAVAVILMASLAAVIDTAKGGMSGVILGCALAYLTVLRKPITMKVVLVSLAILIPVMWLMIVTFMGSSDIWTSVESVWDRLVFGNLVPGYHVVDLFRNGDFLMGRTFPNPLRLLPFEPYDLDREVWLRLNYVPTLETIYTAPSVMWAEMYANFGIPGVVVAAPLFGIFLRAIELPLGQVRSAPIRSGLVAFVSLYCVSMVTKGLITVLALAFDYYILSVLGAAAIIVYCDSGRTLRHRAAAAPRPPGAAPVAPAPAPIPAPVAVMAAVPVPAHARRRRH